jgi:hypothetical protein
MFLRLVNHGPFLSKFSHGRLLVQTLKVPYVDPPSRDDINICLLLQYPSGFLAQ